MARLMWMDEWRLIEAGLMSPPTLKREKFLVGVSNVSLVKYVKDRIDRADEQLMSEPKHNPQMHGKRTNSWKPIQRGRR